MDGDDYFISVDATKYEFDLKFKISSTFSHSNNLLKHQSEYITFAAAACLDCNNPVHPNDGITPMPFTLLEPDGISEQ